MQHVDFEPVTNREYWVNTSEVHDEDNGDLVDLSTAVIVVSVRHRDSGRVVLSARTADATISIDGLGIFTHTFTDQQMRALHPLVYEVGCTIQLNGVVKQWYIGHLPILDGIVE
jgi:hypothetical protein